MENKALVLEGGGFRCAFSLGVLKAFEDRGVEFPLVVGISGGAISAMEFLAGNSLRLLKVGVEGLQEMVKSMGEGLLDMEKIFQKLYGEDNFDWEAFRKSPSKISVGLVSPKDIKMHYFDDIKEVDRERAIKYLAASSAVPGVAKPVNIDGVDYYDGGMIDSVPYPKAIEEGYEDMVIVLTKEEDAKISDNPRYTLAYDETPYREFADYLKKRGGKYKEDREEVKRLVKGNKAEALYPSTMKIDTFTMDISIIMETVKDGYNIGKDLVEKMGL